MTATEIPDEVLDWSMSYWQDCAWDAHGVAFVCMYSYMASRPDRRCRSGVREWLESCHHQFGEWDTIRELIEAVQSHVKESH